MTEERTDGYARALLDVARSESAIGEVEDELFRVARVVEGNDELRTTLTDAQLPASRRQQIVEDLLGGRAHPVTTALVSMLVGTGRGLTTVKSGPTFVWLARGHRYASYALVPLLVGHVLLAATSEPAPEGRPGHRPMGAGSTLGGA